MKRISKSQSDDSAEHSDDQVSEKRPRHAVDTSGTLPDVNLLIIKETLITLQSMANAEHNVDMMLSLAFRDVYKDPQWHEVLQGDYIHTLSCHKYVQNNGPKLIITSAKNQDYTELFSEQGGLRKSQPTIGNENQLVEVQESMAATESSWNMDFKGNSADSLFNYMCLNFKNKNLYARYCAIVQSSGMGKSRLVDELSKKHLVVPICLRKEGTKGFPPADEEVRNFLLSSKNSKQAGEYSSAFLSAVGYELLEWLKKKNFSSSSCSLEQIAREFRIYMTEGMKYTSHNSNRVTFYKNIIERARELVSRKVGIVVNVADNSAKDQKSLPRTKFHFEPNLDAETPFTNTSSKVDANTTLKGVVDMLVQFLGHNGILPTVIFAYDEAHTLTEPVAIGYGGTELWRLAELRRAICSTRYISTFSLFLSTTGKVSQGGKSSTQDPSSRIQGGVLRHLYPFSDLSFDLFALDLSSPKASTLEFFAGIEYIVSLGRPLFYTRFRRGNVNVRENIIRFAAEKLLGTDPDTIWQQNLDITRPQWLACLSVRLNLDFQPRNPEPEVELTQIESHMRVCLEMNDRSDHIESVAASEPLLAEAAAGVMMSGLFHPAEALSFEFYRPQIDRGVRSEAVVALMQLLVRDKLLKGKLNSSELPAYSIYVDRIIKVVDFLQEFFVDHKVVEDATPSCVYSGNVSDLSQALPTKRFSDMFANSHCYFSHFIKVTEHTQVKRKLLLGLALRGASIICANCIPDVDIITPFFYWDTKVAKENLSVILWQCKNEGEYGQTPKRELFDAMDPYQLRIFDSQDAPPIIRIVTALAASDVGLVNVTNGSRPSTGSSFTSYDFWAYGFHKSLYKVLGYPVNEGGGDSEWKTLLDVSVASTVFRKRNRSTDEMIAIRRRQHPGRSAEEGHYSWCEELL